MNNLLSYCELADAKIRASEIDLPVKKLCFLSVEIQIWIPFLRTDMTRKKKTFKLGTSLLVSINERVTYL